VERKRLLRLWVRGITLATGDLEIETNYQIPEPAVNSVPAEVGILAEKKLPGRTTDFDFERIQTSLRRTLTRCCNLPYRTGL
jgi:hypothetical protein